MKLIVGLGNVGDEYAGTRHNVGFAVVDELARRHGAAWRQEHAKHGFVHAVWLAEPQPGHLIRPVRLMNRSGEGLAHAAGVWRVKPEEILIVCDDVNLPLGALRLRAQGGPGGHHGLASCLEQLQTEEIARLRLGIGVTALPRDLTDFVLSAFRRDERPAIEQAMMQAADMCESWASNGV